MEIINTSIKRLAKSMWPFISKISIEDSGFLKNFTDWHSHILPGVDDGIDKMEDAIKVLKEYERLGIKKVWLTPHIMEDYPNETHRLKEKFEELKNEWHGNVELKLASENMLDTMLEERLQTEDLLPIGENQTHLLVETSYFTPPFGMKDMLSNIKKKGYNVILAHPERYRYMEENNYNDLKKENVLFQLNFLSLVGAYGDTARKKAEWLLRKGYIDILGSDIHNLIGFKNWLKNFSVKKHVYGTLSVLKDNHL